MSSRSFCFYRKKPAVLFAGIRAYGVTRNAQITYTNDKKVKQTWKVNSKMFKDLWLAETLVYEYITKTKDKILYNSRTKKGVSMCDSKV